jgi:hypothetical protein
MLRTNRLGHLVLDVEVRVLKYFEGLNWVGCALCTAFF